MQIAAIGKELLTIHHVVDCCIYIDVFVGLFVCVPVYGNVGLLASLFDCLPI